MSETPATSLIETLWASFGPVVEERLAAVERGVAALALGAPGDDPRVRDAHAAAHALAGALGSYGRAAAGETARAAMVALEAPAPQTPELRALVTRLREQIR